MSIHRLTPSHAEAFRRLRLHGLQESPTAFGSSHDEEKDRPISSFEERLVGGTDAWVFGYFLDGELVGIVGVDRESGSKEHHRGVIRSMYVRPDARGHGIGKALMAQALACASAMPGLRQLNLAVTAGNRAAIATYEAFGFRMWGTAPDALYVDGRYLDEVHMVLHLEAPAAPFALR